MIFDAVQSALRRFRFTWADEDDLQSAIESALIISEIDFKREHDLGEAGRVDFFLDGVALEVKTHGSRFAVLRQLHRYAEHDDVTAVLLVTPSMKLDAPPTLNGKPCGVCRLV